MIVLNSAKAVSDIFDKRGSNYSDRPDMPMIVDLYAITYARILQDDILYLYRMGWDWTFALMRYGPRWKEHRRVFHSHFNHSVAEHQEIQLEISKELLTLLLKSPEEYVAHIKQYALSHCCTVHLSVSLLPSYTAHIIMKRV
jgi:cytochrome P450